MTKAQMAQMVQRAADIMEELDAVKPLYGELDEITTALCEAGFTATKDGSLMLVDNFAEKNVQWKAASFKRFELKRPK